MTPLEQISQDLDWREGELGSLKILLGRNDITTAQRKVLLRAAWAMLYAHYEGFVKAALTVFYDEAKKRVANCGHLPKETRVSALKPELNKLKSMPAVAFLDAIDNFNIRYYSQSPDFPEIDTQHNLWPNTLSDLLRTADIDGLSVDKYRIRLKTLVSRSNDIAHGKQDVITDYDYYIEYESAVYALMYELAFEIDLRLMSAPYA